MSGAFAASSLDSFHVLYSNNVVYPLSNRTVQDIDAAHPCASPVQFASCLSLQCQTIAYGRPMWAEEHLPWWNVRLRCVLVIIARCKLLSWSSSFVATNTSSILRTLYLLANRAFATGSVLRRISPEVAEKMRNAVQTSPDAEVPRTLRLLGLRMS